MTPPVGGVYVSDYHKIPASREFWLKWLERVLWTAVQAALGLVTVDLFDLPTAWVPVIATALAAVKGWVARRVGDPQEPSTLPWGV